MTDMMTHYLTVKEEYDDCILFYRLGDFYEMFFSDAVLVSRELELTLTGKDCGMKERAPMCGVPFHSADIYISKLIALGYKVAICEQIGDPKKTKGIVEREVVRVITPGTTVSETNLDEGVNNFLITKYADSKGVGFAAADTSTGEISATEINEPRYIIDELASYSTREIMINENFPENIKEQIERNFNIKCTYKEEMFVDNGDEVVTSHFKKSLDELNLLGKDRAIMAIAAAIGYIQFARKTDIRYINRLNIYNIKSYMELDFATRRNLEITETMRDKAKRGTLFWVLDKTKTSMGRRLLRRWIERPLLEPADINRRLSSVKELVDNVMVRDDISEVLSKTYDISRIISRIALKTVTPKDMVSLKQTLMQLPALEYCLSQMKSPILKDMSQNFDILADVAKLIDDAIDEEKAGAIIRDGGMIKTGYNQEVDRLRSIKKDNKKWLDDYEESERKKTGIPKLKTGYNKVFGYFIEITNSYKDSAPDYYIRKQTLTNAERYITPELKEYENEVLGSEDRLKALEIELYNELRDKIECDLERLKRAAKILSVTDVLCSLATVAYKNKYCMPEVNKDGVIDIKEGRHPVVETLSKDIIFVPNDLFIDNDKSRLLIITGPNMAGKSTYMRQTAIITLMAQIGSFVPAKSARIGVVDRIFTRVGASDDIASGQSTFMLEMTEVSNILENATKNSLIILDEIGRGTSTYDGLSIAWAVAEYINNKKTIGAKTMFATHYHELTELEDKLEGVRNYRVAVNKQGDNITFLRRIVRGGADESYGIEVAALAGVPKTVIKRAKEILKSITDGDTEGLYGANKPADENHDQVGMEELQGMALVEELKNMDVTTMTAIDAMNTLYRLSLKAKEL